MNTMNTAMAVAQNSGVGENLAFLAFPAKRASEEVSATIEELVTAITTLLAQLLADTIAAKTGDEFRVARDKAFGGYAQAMLALNNLISVSVANPTIERLTTESLAEMEQAFRETDRIFGYDIAEQAAFTVWTLRKLSLLVNECNRRNVAHEMKGADLEFARQYVGHVLFARFHLDCLSLALTKGQTIFPEALLEISAGLRSAVDAYAWVRHGLELRSERQLEQAIEVPWDEEQDELMQESTADLLREVY